MRVFQGELKMKKLFMILAMICVFASVTNCCAVEKGAAESEIKVLKAVYADAFDVRNGDPKSRGWTFWSPEGSTLESFHDKNYGSKAKGSLCVVSAKRAYWFKKASIAGGGIYRFSMQVRVSAGINQIGIAVQGLDENDKAIATLLPESLEDMAGGSWRKFERIFFVPQAGGSSRKKVAKLNLRLIGRSVKDKAWFDDVKVEKIEIISPCYDGFKQADTKWQSYIRPGNEGGGEIKHLPVGYANAGAVKVKHTYGTPGISAAKVFSLPASADNGYLTFSVYAASADKAETAVSVQQLDAYGGIINEDSGKPTPTTDWVNRRLTVKVNEKTAGLKVMLLNNSKNASAVFDNLYIRPARADEIPVDKEKFPVKVALYPADAVASIDKSAPRITVLSGQASAIGVHLAGQHRKDATTTVDIEVPSWLKLLTAQQAVYGKEVIEWKEIQLKEKQRTVYRFINPYPWQKGAAEYKFNPYSNLLLVFRAETKAGAEDSIVIKTKLDDDNGQTRKFKLLVMESLAPLPQLLKEFKIGMWSQDWLNLLDDDARDKLISTYANAGFNLGHVRARSSYAGETYKKYDFDVFACIIHDPGVADCYKSSPDIMKNSMITVDGKPYKAHIAIGLALEDKATHDAYKKYLKDKLYNFPDGGKYVFNDTEYWGLGRTDKTCFHPSTIAAFRKYAKLGNDVKLTPEII
jgi:hypothetical protein